MVTTNGHIHDVAGVRIGHTSELPVRSGCTVIAFDAPALTAVEVRGAAPGTRELDLLMPGRTVQRADAILLAGGSAFGLGAAEGVMQVLQTQGRGFPTPVIAVPIVPAAVIFDLATVYPYVPTAADGANALRSSAPLSEVEVGAVGVGTGAMTARILGPEGERPGGFALGQVDVAGGSVTAAVVCNALGVIQPTDDPRPAAINALTASPFGVNTTLMAVVTDIHCSHDTLGRMCVAAHDALARMVWPAHTVADGDVAFASCVAGDQPVADRTLPLCLATELAVEAALRVIGERAG